MNDILKAEILETIEETVSDLWELHRFLDTVAQKSREERNQTFATIAESRVKEIHERIVMMIRAENSLRDLWGWRNVEQGPQPSNVVKFRPKATLDYLKNNGET